MKRMKRSLSLALPAHAAESTGFPDTQSHYAKAAVETWSGYGVLKGYEDGTFRPDGQITRAEMAAVVDRVMGYQDKAENTFSDLPAQRWYTDCLLRLAAAGVFKGNEDGTMKPEEPITRQEAFAALSRVLDLDESEKDPGFTDDQSVAGWAKGYVSAMKEAGYIQGDQKGAIRAEDPITRAEVVTILNKMAAGFVNTDGEYSEDCKGNLIVNAHDVTLKDMTVSGDLIVADGVNDGDVYLDKVTVKGDVILRGCGENSFHILKGSAVTGKIIVTKTTKGVIRLVNESGKTIPMVYVNDGKSGVVLDGDALGEVVVACDAPVSIASKKVKTVSVTGNAKVTVEKGTTVSKVLLGKTAKDAALTVCGKVTSLTNDAKIKVTKDGGTVGSGSSGGGSSSSSGGSSSGGSSTPATPTVISEVSLQLMPPAFGNIPDTADVLGTGYTAETKWLNADGTAPSYRWKAADSDEKDTFTAKQAYQAVVTLSPMTGYTFGENVTVKVTDNDVDFAPAKSEKSGSNWVVTMTYDATAEVEFVQGVEATGPDYVYVDKGAKLKVIYGDNQLIDPATYTYQWYKCTDAVGNGKTAIAGANGVEYTLPAADIKVGKTAYYTAEVTAGGTTYAAFNVKAVEMRDCPPISIDDIPTPSFGEKVRFEDIPQSEIKDTINRYIDVSGLVDHPDVMYIGDATALGSGDTFEAYGETKQYMDACGGSIVNKITADGTGEIEIESTISGPYYSDILSGDTTKVYDFVVDSIYVSLTPKYRSAGQWTELDDKKAEKHYYLDQEDIIHYHVIGMDAQVEGEAAQYRPANDTKLVVNAGTCGIEFVNADGSQAMPEKCNYANIWLPDVDYNQRIGLDYFKQYGCFLVGSEWIKGVQDGKLGDRDLEATVTIIVPGSTRHHLYVYFMKIPADRIEFAGNDG